MHLVKRFISYCVLVMTREPSSSPRTPSFEASYDRRNGEIFPLPDSAATVPSMAIGKCTTNMIVGASQKR